ncbi:MAG: tetratricopeptide repeat protein [Arthrospira platensis PCC 7345]|mgnify:CR=1 FL=1|uniref:TPR domain protein n=1 Tax=Limnospira platensis NIES-46 TaxID=1236695 RepID=A0A5M3T1Z9_LIMPL|nr:MULTISPECIES: tetratricopeptide repeat protein [Arthrospira]MDF2207857.1 tetratricopeptide repeat protein [Arthrospira platensis NCB002]MDT9184146.1 tetratricopeptide repeat protein [Limnospira sp. PMC 289.06]MDT9296345.1 tetratricopeptide repeat protein [Arthrospira platensis PCC 7345]MDT9311940.1 tetratricopeptide repeat protein [Limnospira sp. Paracas R14]BDT15126.1 TPR domain protein [Arthrospira platensis NIES-39]
MLWTSIFSHFTSRPKRLIRPLGGLLLTLPMLVSLTGVRQPAFAQALLPYTLQVDSEHLQQTGEGLIEEAAQLTRFQQYQLALPRAELATQLAPNNYQTWALLGSLYIQVDRTEAGIEALNRAQALAPDNPAIRFVLGEAYFRKGEYQRSVEQIQQGLRINPNVPGALFDLGNAYFQLGQFEQAIAQYEEAYKQERLLWPAINNIGLVEYELGKTDSAVQRWEEAFAIDETAAEPLLAIAVALYQQGDTERALTLGEQALQLDSRYAELEFLRENLWGDRLMEDARTFLSTPRMRQTISRL